MITIIVVKCWLLLTLAAMPPPQVTLGDNPANSGAAGVLVTYAPPVR